MHYPKLNFRHPRYGHIQINAARVFLILRLGTPIPLGMDATHTHGCTDHRCVRHVDARPYSENRATHVPDLAQQRAAFEELNDGVPF